MKVAPNGLTYLLEKLYFFETPNYFSRFIPFSMPLEKEQNLEIYFHFLWAGPVKPTCHPFTHQPAPPF
jgi:hypothetical protein